MEQIKNIKKGYQRCTQDQLGYYVTFLEKHPELLQNKINSANPQQTAKLWDELTVILNSLTGPTRNTQKWKESLNHWKNQLKSRARIKTSLNRASGKSLRKCNIMTTFEERALAIFGAIAFDELPSVLSTGVEVPIEHDLEVMDINDPLNSRQETFSFASEIKQETDLSMPEANNITPEVNNTTPKINNMEQEPNTRLVTHNIASQTDLRRNRNNTKLGVYSAINSLVTVIKMRNDRERKFWDQHLKMQQELVGAVKNLTKVLDKSN